MANSAIAAPRSRLLREPPPVHGVAAPVASGIGRLVARNAGAFTYHGTNTWLIDTANGVFVVDPGPDDPVHINDIITAASWNVAGIVLTHGHADHAGALPELRRATGAALADAPPGWERLATPGHSADHACFARADGVVLTGDTVMGWTSGVVEDMTAYMASLRLLSQRPDSLYLPGHGPVIRHPARFTAGLLEWRLAREAAILALLPRPLDRIVAHLYRDTPPELLGAARANVVAHLRKLEAEGRVPVLPGGRAAR